MKTITLANLPYSSKQQVFDWVAYNLLKQNKASIDVENGLCVYRSPEGLKCAAGWCISDKEYNHSFEGHTWKELIRYENIPSNNMELIDELQSVHDNGIGTIHPGVRNRPFWKKSLIRCAKNHDLNYDVVTNFNK
jgi:hypothetical protein